MGEQVFIEGDNRNGIGGVVVEPGVVTMVRSDLRASMSRMVVTSSPVE